MDKIKAFMSFLEESKFKEHRLANANLDMCYSKFGMDKLLAILKEKHEMAKAASILATDFYDGVCYVQVMYEDFEVLTAEINEIRIEPSIFEPMKSEYLFSEVDGIHLVTVRKVENKKMQAQ
ncbi:hypothetical protein ACMGD3_07560 [Lysinibacillus sphaericus]|uniref:hypothetical protein n=1 Tax=Lysinibacillus sphaericus TaxID=1421 RepID=UPI003F7AEEA1